MRITDEIKEEILQRTDLVELIGSVVNLRKRGRNYLGLCPFHSEKTPSFNVNLERGFYKCFGCGVAGNAISFMMEYHGLSFPDAVKELARQTGVNLPEEGPSGEAEVKQTRREKALNALNTANNFYQRQMKTSLGEVALKYFVSRGFTRDTIDKWGLGYSPDAWRSLMDLLKKQKFDVDTMKDAGLVAESEHSTYDRFRNRAMFPIQDVLGRVIGFGARLLNNDKKQAKYLNSPQSLVYDKSKTLFGLNFAKNEIRSQGYAIMTEGYMDVISLHQAGFETAVASSGTALTTEQLEVLYRYCQKIYLCYDGDRAGVAATEKAIELAIKAFYEVYVIRLPEGEDPDSIVTKRGKKVFSAYVDDAEDFLSFKLALYEERDQLKNPAGKARAAREIMKLIMMIPDRLQHDEYIKMLADKLQFSSDQLKSLYKEKTTLERKNESKAINEEIRRDSSEQLIEDKREKIVAKQHTRMKEEEKVLVTLAIAKSEALEAMINIFEISDDDFKSDEGKRLFGIILEYYNPEKDMLTLLLDSDEISKEDKSFFADIPMKMEQDSPNWKKFSSAQEEGDYNRMIKDSLYKMESELILMQKNDIMSTLKSAKDFQEQINLNKMIVELDNKMAELKTRFDISQ
jgi:DNA primase